MAAAAAAATAAEALEVQANAAGYAALVDTVAANSDAAKAAVSLQQLDMIGVSATLAALKAAAEAETDPTVKQALLAQVAAEETKVVEAQAAITTQQVSACAATLLKQY